MRFVYFVLVLLVSVFNFAVAQEQVHVSGYYREDGSYVKERVIDPIPQDSKIVPELSKTIWIRKTQLRRFYEGKMVVSKVSFPACHAGFKLPLENPTRGNVNIFTKVNKYGSSIPKDSKAIITKFKVKSDTIIIELNNGGYGSFGDISGRAFLDIFSLGLNEMRDYDRIRHQHGSRVIISSSKEWKTADLTFEKVSEYLVPVLDVL